MNLNIVCIPGDGIGPEVIAEAKWVLNKTIEKYSHNIVYKDALMGGASIDAYGEPLTDKVIDMAKAADAVLLGSIGGNTATSSWYKLAPELRPEAGLLRLRKELNLFANLNLEEEAGKIELAVKQVLKEGYRTVDIMPQDKNQCKTVKQVSTEAMGKLIAEYI